MKKLHLHKIFHWLYAFLMFCPILSYLLQYVVAFGTGNFDNIISVFEDSISVGFDFNRGVGSQLWEFFDYLFVDVLGVSQYNDGFNSLFAYWVVISIVWLVFDVLMYIINVAHHWLDAGGDKL